MMQLVHIALVQWHLFDREDLAIAGDTAILGQNRSGKSTLIDLIQAVMTGGGPGVGTNSTARRAKPATANRSGPCAATAWVNSTSMSFCEKRL
ncbi:ATP-binding protein [Mesorhizobium sp. LNJC405B00]|uniref:ATP-binding protein n=1 Tax=Mesorhizobium sp. LNJC405B00 TaxID=1287281 RepID=UPI0003CF7108|nr:ATP-binding protein [Mesorhizobium sp. LNJC405B00]ESX83498.1 hypothetical protein X755_32720 [Mesorhizobium sp. LNJC405B00]